MGGESQFLRAEEFALGRVSAHLPGMGLVQDRVHERGQGMVSVVVVALAWAVAVDEAGALGQALVPV